MRCPDCGAHNPDTASWCGLCHGVFAEAEAPAPAAEVPQGARPDFRRTEEGFEWACPTCEAYTSMDLHRCQRCGTALAALQEPEAPPKVVGWEAAIGASVFLPGAGHVLAGRAGQGLARALLYLVWVLGGNMIAGSALPGAALAVAPLWAGAAALWAGSLADLARMRKDRPPLLSARTMLWTVVAVTGLSMLGMLVAAMGAGGAGAPGQTA